MSLSEVIEKEHYIIKCKDFIHYPKVVRVIGMLYTTCGEEVKFVLDDYDSMNEEIEMFYEELTRHDSYEQCKYRCDMLNNLPINKKRAKEWNSPETQEKLRKLASIREMENK